MTTGRGLDTLIAGASTQDWARLACAAGVFAALCWLLAFPYVYYAPLGNPDGPMLAWTSLALAATAETLRNGLTPGRAALLGGFVACAGATKDQAAASFVLVAPALLALHFASGARHRGRAVTARITAITPATLP